MKRIVDYDPVSGMSTTFEYLPDGQFVVGREQDVEPLLEYNKALAKDDERTRRGIKSGWWEYAHYPPIIIEKWLNEFGVNIFDKNHAKRIMELTNRPEYRYLKTTSKTHTLPR